MSGANQTARQADAVPVAVTRLPGAAGLDLPAYETELAAGAAETTTKKSMVRKFPGTRSRLLKIIRHRTWTRPVSVNPSLNVTVTMP